MRTRNLLMTFASIFLSLQLFSQTPISRPAVMLKLTMQLDGGSNGAAVVYNPDQQLYYAVFAGNAEYPLETFDRRGNNVYTAFAGYDMRGMWWNPKAKSLEGNCYSDGGIVTFILDEKGYAEGGNEVIFEGGYHQPHEHAVGVFEPVKKQILYFDYVSVEGYSRKNGKPNKTFVYPDVPVDINSINWSSMIYTGVEDYEIGLLDFVSKKIYLFDWSGYLTGTISLPEDAPVHDAFNFSYANGMAFLFDTDLRVWTGYKLFE